jgi:translation initiation factor 2 beta subunit (eIF-2beta)/eIF-5
MIIRNPKANPNSKAQKAKQEYFKQHPIEYVVCKKCGIKNNTLYKQKDNTYLCCNCVK